MFEQFVVLFDWVGVVSTIIWLITLIFALVVWIKGVLPTLIRLGNGLSKRKIALFAKGNQQASLEALLLDSKLFSKKNIISITSEGDIGRTEKATLYLVYWPDWQDRITEILRAKGDTTALIVYAPELGSIPSDKAKELNLERNVTIVNFRGRLLNDLLVSMMTTSYQ